MRLQGRILGGGRRSSYVLPAVYYLLDSVSSILQRLDTTSRRLTETCLNSTRLWDGGTSSNLETLNAIFALTAESLRDPSTKAPLGSANYTGEALDNCRVNRIYMMAEFATHDVRWRAQVACNTTELFANFTVESIVTLRSGVPNGIVNVDTLGRIENEQNGPEAIVTSVLYALGLDVLAGLFFRAPQVTSISFARNVSASALWAEWDPLAQNGSRPMVVSGLAAPDGSYLIGPNSNVLADLLPPARQSLENYAIAFHDAILVDVGSTVYSRDRRPDNNILTSTTTLQSKIRTSDLLETYMIPTNGSSNGLNFSIPVAPFLLSHTRDFRLPIAARKTDDEAGAARLVQRYLCHNMVLKPPATLVVDVAVATVSMFMVAWGLAQIVLMYFAKQHTTDGNYCACPTCDSYVHRLFPPNIPRGIMSGEKSSLSGQSA
ncbi:hypothetical protein RhiJN_21409 [Ceratobasidium sp. AG-Ba]|nr:hypothetical protein RhiJN_21409 [Ceratobasidium sp. AG-Ba]